MPQLHDLSNDSQPIDIIYVYFYFDLPEALYTFVQIVSEYVRGRRPCREGTVRLECAFEHEIRPNFLHT